MGLTTGRFIIIFPKLNLKKKNCIKFYIRFMNDAHFVVYDIINMILRTCY